MTDRLDKNGVDYLGFWKNRTITKEVKNEENI